MASFYKEKENNDGDGGGINFVEILNENRDIIRQGRFIILNTSIIYNVEEDFYYTLATCVNDNNEIETISIEGFGIQENILDFKGAYIDYEEYKIDSQINYTGTIYNL
ncbi:hypothetical protein [Clostridium lacusfryxellense]|uniref:hypothetical protein n=1 Tax=Clostridium lacusfryxellense TaxID=205328 RepID=UPI001C0C46A2|nr:hypothetical protein [Clostridium lacusfryxellense]MBU3114080.1 hypothetical protein [Clostridium lacusfryxellense]